MRELKSAVASDLAIHGFSYLAMLITFVGVFGYLFFNFTDLEDEVQPLVEIGVPVLFFSWAWRMRRYEALVVAQAMEALGGLLLPVVIFASIVDGAPFPPDLTEGPLIVGLFVVGIVVARTYVWWSGLHPRSTLKYLAGPSVWFGALALGFVFKSDEPLIGPAITRLVSAQPAIAAVAVAVTLAAITRVPDHRMTRPTSLAALPAVAVTYALTVGLAANEGWTSSVPVTVAGLSTMLSAELLGRRFDKRRQVRVLHPLLLVSVLAPLIPVWGPGWAGAATAISYLLWIEWELHSDSNATVGIWIGLAGAMTGLAMSVDTPWAMVAAWSLASVWAHRRRIVGIADAAAGPLLTAAAALSPVVVASGLLEVLPDDVAWLVISGVFALVAGGVRVAHTGDVFWATWPSAAAVATVGGVTGQWLADPVELSAGLVVTAIALASLVLAIGPRWSAARVWLASGSMVIATAIALDDAALSSGAESVAWAGIGVAAVAAAAAWRRGAADHLAVVGHSIGTAVLLTTGVSEGSWATVLGFAAAGWVVTVVTDETGGRSIAGLLDRLTALVIDDDQNKLRRAVRALPQLIMASIVPVAALAVADQWDTFAANRSWTGVALAFAAVAYALNARIFRRRSSLARILATAAMVMAVIGIAVAAPVPWPSIEASGSLIIVAAVLSGDQRRRAFTWFAWIMSGVMTILLAERAGLSPSHLRFVAIGWAAVLLVGGLALDDVRAGRRRPGEGLRLESFHAPVGIGALALPLTLAPTFADSQSVIGWWALAAAAVYFIAALQIRAGVVTAPAYALAGFGAAVLLPGSPFDEYWILLVVAAGLVVASWLSSLQPARRDESDLWLRWDLPPLVVAHILAVIALAHSAVFGVATTTWIGFGGLSVAVGVWKRNRIWVDVGNVLALIGAAVSGVAALALALAW
jgi:hypothetical protein